MANSAPLGVFDSGVGGLSILKEIRFLLPVEDLIYLADSSHCPYGTKTTEAIRQRTLEVTDFLLAQGAKAIVVACNSACVAGLDQIREAHPGLPVIGVEPAIKPAHDLTRNGKIGVLATNMTIRGARFNLLVEKYGGGVEVYTQPGPGLVELVEAGKAESPEAEALLQKYLGPLFEKGVDTLVLGCTHYPFLRPLIAKLGGPELVIIDTGLAVARQTLRVLAEQGLAKPDGLPGWERFYTTGDPEQVATVIAELWGEESVEVAKAKF